MKIQRLPIRGTRSMVNAMATLTLMGALGSAQAAIFKDPQLEALQDAGKYAELEQPAQTRLKTNSANAEASAALSLALTFVDTSDAKRLEAGANQAKLCTEQHSNVAVCHLAAAQNLNMQMLNMGIAKAMHSVGNMKDLWIRALELEPTSFTARVQLAKLFVTVPGMMGGSISKAKELEAAVRSSQPETARIIRVHIAGEATMQLGLVFFKNATDLAKPRACMSLCKATNPAKLPVFAAQHAYRPHWVSRDEAIRLFERSKTLTGAEDYPIDHRLGNTLLAKGHKVQAKVAYERFIANQRSRPADVEEERKSLAKLG